MKQVIQLLGKGETVVMNIPCPKVRHGHLLLQSHVSLVSPGTERMLVEFGKSNYLEKMRQQPDKVRMVLDKIRTDGVFATLEAVQAKLDQPLSLGYCNVGIVLEVGEGVTGFSVGDRVVSNGPHAEVVCVPQNLCARVPADVNDESAAFTVLGAIGLQGVRLAQPALGETFVVTGLGLIGLLTVQLLRAHGCRVLGIDLDPRRVALARAFGAETVDLATGADPLDAAHAFSRGRGVDGVLITASTRSNEPVHQAAQMCRKRGRIVLVGVTGLTLSRSDFYQKELTFQVSCSYGPGRYDPEYEQKGRDYPLGFVRWTEQRNFEAVLDMLADRRVDTGALVSDRYPVERAVEAYARLSDSAALGILLQYAARPRAELLQPRVELPRRGVVPAGKPCVSVIGAGNYGSRVLIPAFKTAGARLRTLVSSGGVSGVHYGARYGFEDTATDADAVLDDADADAIVVATRHDSHASLAARALRAGKHVFVEKPLALTPAEQDTVEAAYQASRPRDRSPILMVGFNRRFAPHVRRAKALLETVAEPKVFVMTVNAGFIPESHWTQDRDIGGGRIIGEACHFIDLLRFFADAPIVEAQVSTIGKAPGVTVRDDKTSFTLRFADGSLGTVHYLANGHKSFPKERLEIFCAGRVLQLDNYRRLRAWGWGTFKGARSWRQDKGQRACVAAFVEAVRNGSPAPIPYEQTLEVSRWSLRIAEQSAR